ncbi:LCP family protein [Leucobacter chinensis]|uniref:LCP family protein n=1 Tax=Leucobacter chinensis TaxID=2851010 RepID=UPI001C24B2C5|nr:LCP family protein [Leucobacter chinensis]
MPRPSGFDHDRFPAQGRTGNPVNGQAAGSTGDSGNSNAASRKRMSGKRRKRLFAMIGIVLASALIIGIAAVAWGLRSFDDSIVRSEFSLPMVENPVEETGEQNILVMGMDTRVDLNGDPLPGEVYDALHAGGADDGGYNANVLMLLHIPEDRSQAVGISIPRDDYVEIVGSPLGVSHSKIKEAYGLAMQERMNELYLDESYTAEEAYHEARAAGRQAQIETVSHFLGDVKIDHFVEMTMGGFYHVAQAVQPITVCLNHATEDFYSGADFEAGVQEIDAEQAISFVRQRRDTGFDGPSLTDLDRSRRQQAFIIALADKLRDQSTLTNPKTVTSLMGVTQDHVALDSNFDVFSLLKVFREVAGSGARFVTLPIIEFDKIDGSWVNTVDVDEVQSVVSAIFDGSYFEALEAENGEQGEGGAAGSESPWGPEPGEEGQEAGGSAPSDRPDEAGGAGAEEGEGPDDGLTVYESWDEPIQAGSIPCVN